MDITSLSARRIAELIAKKKLSCSEVAQAYLSKIESSANNTFTALGDPMAKARILDGLQPKGALFGVPYAAKDNIVTKGVLTTCASRALFGYIPPYNAAAVERLECCTLLGKTNMDEFAMGSDTRTSCYGRVKNPLFPDRVPGGSSGGSAAAVAADEAAFALGSDTGGSVRQPAAYCGAVGILPTRGRVSRWGLVAYASSLDQIGTLTKTVEDGALVLSAISGADARDATTVENADDITASLEAGVKGKVIGVVEELMCAAGEAARTAVLRAARTLEAAGARLESVSIPECGEILFSYQTIACAEALSNLARYDGIRFCGSGEETLTFRERLGDEVKSRLIYGAWVLKGENSSSLYLGACKARERLSKAFARALEGRGALISPAAPGLPPLADAPPCSGDELFTAAANLAGLPAMVLPCTAGLAVHIMSGKMREGDMLRTARVLENEGI